jgi:hypothetical protein
MKRYQQQLDKSVFYHQVLLDKLKRQLETNGGENDRSARMEEARSSHLVEAGAFRASEGWHQTEEVLGSDVQTLFWMEAHCNAYEGKLTDLSKVKLSKDFTEAVEQLPDRFPMCHARGGRRLLQEDRFDAANVHAPPPVDDMEAGGNGKEELPLVPWQHCPKEHQMYMEFIGQFGTHFTTAVTYGAKEVLQAVLKNLQLRQLRDTMHLDDIKAADAILRPYIHRKELVKGMQERQTPLTAPYSVRNLKVGQAIPDTGDPEDWELAVQDNPEPINNALTPLWKLMPEPKGSNFLKATLTYMSYLKVDPGALAALESHFTSNFGPSVVYRAATVVDVNPKSSDSFLRAPGWNTVGTFIYHIPTGWVGQPTVVLVSLARTFALPYYVNTEFRLVYNQNVSGGSIGMSGASDPAKMGGVHFHDVLPLPSWSRLRIRFEASCRTVHHVATHNRTQMALSGGDYAKLSYPADDLGLQFRRFTLLQVPKTALQTQFWNDTWSVLNSIEFSALTPPMSIEKLKCVRGHKLIILAHISRVQQTFGPITNFGVRITFDQKPVALSFTGDILHSNFSEMTMHTVVPCVHSAKPTLHHAEVQMVADEKIVLSNSEAGRQTRRLTSMMVSTKHVWQRSWQIQKTEGGSPNEWQELPTPASLTVEIPQDSEANIVIFADISSVQCEKSVEFILFVDGIGAVGYAALGHEATTAGRSVSFHAMTTVHAGTFDVHIRYRASQGGQVEFGSSDYHGMVGQQRRLTAVMVHGYQMASLQGSDDLALGKPAVQSSTYKDASAAKAVDGDATPWWVTGSVSQTQAHMDSETPAFLEVDLERNHLVARIELFTRIKASRVPRDFDIIVYDKARQETYRRHVTQLDARLRAQGEGGNLKYVLWLPSVIGCYIRLQLRSRGVLSIAEMAVFPPQ